MKHLSKNTWLILFFTFILLVFVSSCKKKNNYSIKGIVVKTTTGEPLEGVVVEVYKEICQGSLFNGGCGPDPDDFHSATTNAKGEFEMAFTSKQGSLIIKFTKNYMRIFNSDTDRTGRVNSGITSLDNVSMHAGAEWFTIEFEPSISNVKEVTLNFEWDRFPEGSAKNVIWGTFPSYFTIFDNPRRPTSLERFGEQWLKMNFDILLEDNSRMQKTDSIWLPGRYYDFNDYDFGDPRKFPVYKFSY